MSKSKQEDVFQAILIADNFSSSIFGSECPLTQEGIIPLANRKIIDYALEALTVSGVQEIFLFCSNQADSIKEHIKLSKWSDLPNTINVICSDSVHSLGDALRDLDAKGCIRNDFILMSAGVVTNIALRPLLECHRKIVKEDKGAVMTLVHRKILPGHRSRPENQNPAIVVDSNNGKIIAYSNKLSGKRLNIPLENVRKEMDVYLDTADTGIAVCSSSVLPLFTDNFDFSSMSDFIKEILVNEEIMGNSIYLHRIEKGFANRVVDFDTFHGISCDILQRWTYPVVPDMLFGCGPDQTVYNMMYNFIYKAPNVKIARDALIGSSVLIGADTHVDKLSKIAHSIIGKKCRIGCNVVITASHIGDNVTIGDGCTIDQCIITDNTEIKKGSSLKPRTIVIKNSTYDIERNEDEIGSESEDDASDSEVDQADGFGSDEDDGLIQEKDFKHFSLEVLESLMRGFTDNVSIDNLIIEIHGSRTANYINFEDVTAGVCKGILALPTKVHPGFYELSVKIQWDQTKQIVEKYKSLMKNYVKNDAAQINALKSIEEYANDNVYFRPLLMQILHYLYDEDVLTEENILEWYENPSFYEASEELRASVKKFIDWLEAASEESDEDD